MRVLIVHSENHYFAGAEKMLGYFVSELVESDSHVAMAVVEGSRMAKLIPQKAKPIRIEASDSFSLGTLWRQAQILKQKRIEFPFDVIHGWAARDWELVSLTAWLCGIPAIGTLHDHPHASFISGKRKRLMRWCGNFGLKKVICVSSAVQNACRNAGYAVNKLAVIHNGLPEITERRYERTTRSFRMGFLAAFSERKGLRDLFQIVDELSITATAPWELHLAGGTQNENGERLLRELRSRYETKKWWHRVHWHGWTESPHDFLKTLDLLVVPSSDFDPFPTVLLEAGQAGIPVLASHVGGVSEIVVDHQTGRVFEPGNVLQAATILNELIMHPDLARQMGRRAKERIKMEFSASKMVAEYRREYFNMAKNV